jgi:hypothetical protein
MQAKEDDSITLDDAPLHRQLASLNVRKSAMTNRISLSPRDLKKRKDSFEFTWKGAWIVQTGCA